MGSLLCLRDDDVIPRGLMADQHDDDPVAPCRPSWSQSCYRFVVSKSPDLAPLPWACINFTCLLWSVLLIIAIHGTEGPLERVFGTFLYLLWNLVTTFIWCFEIGLIVLYRKRESTIIHWMELAIAVYFFQDSVSLMHMIIHMEPDDDLRGELADVILSGCAYLYQLFDSLYIYMRRRRGQTGTTRITGAFDSLSDALMQKAGSSTSRQGAQQHHSADDNYDYGSYDDKKVHYINRGTEIV